MTIIFISAIGGYVAPYCDGDERAQLVADVALDPMYATVDPDPEPWAEGFHPGLLAHAAQARLLAGRADARVMADELWAQNASGWFAYGFDWPSTNQVAPWYSAMDQGEALGLFAKLGMLDEAAAVYLTIRPGSPLVASDGWLLEYVYFPHVLNGAVFAVGGLYEYWQATGDAQVRAYTEHVIEVIARDVHRFRTPGGLSTYEIDGSRRYPEYHSLHVVQLRVLAKMSGMACLRRAADDFAADA
ncbi:MAG: hypothetical protein IT341_10275 [Chloroflexi bacterium]|nr:hypothetical protein [Chloroflexota bacterium]